MARSPIPGSLGNPTRNQSGWVLHKKFNRFSRCVCVIYKFCFIGPIFFVTQLSLTENARTEVDEREGESQTDTDSETFNAL